MIKHTIESGETFSTLSQHYFGDAKHAKAIAETNRISLNDNLVVGNSIVIPERVAAPAGKLEIIDGKSIYHISVTHANIPDVILYSPLREKYLTIANSQGIDDLIAEIKAKGSTPWI